MSGLLEQRLYEWSLAFAFCSAVAVVVCGIVTLAGIRRHGGANRTVRHSASYWIGAASTVVFCASLIPAWSFAGFAVRPADDTPSLGSTNPHSFAGQLEALANRVYTYYAQHQLAALEPIDAHTHITNTGPAFVGVLDQLNMHVLDILYVDDTDPRRGTLEQQRQAASNFIASSHGRATMCTTFDPVHFSDPGFAARAIESLNQDFANGAVAAKVWKNIGMEFKNSAGQYIMPDDAVFQPIYRDIAQHGKTLIIHAADSDRAWDPYTKEVHRQGYYESHAHWDMSALPNPPRKADILKARDNVVAANPDLRVVGAHLGSLTDHLDDLAFVLDRYPNFAIDLAGRILGLSTQRQDLVRAFVLRYQDRILYGTDMSFASGQPDKERAEIWFAEYIEDWRYLATDHMLEIAGQRVEGLNLPDSVLKKIYHDNAVRWIPGVIRPGR